jgi:hypothetical protein
MHESGRGIILFREYQSCWIEIRLGKDTALQRRAVWQPDASVPGENFIPDGHQARRVCVAKLTIMNHSHPTCFLAPLFHGNALIAMHSRSL